MAKKRQTLSATSHMAGDEEAQDNKLKVASSRLKKALEDKGVDVKEFLNDEFGISSSTSYVDFITKSGRKVTFYETQLSHEEVKEKTYVDGVINGREQETLNNRRTSDIDSIEKQQFYHLIGAIESDGRIHILDGSRRRFKYLTCKPDYKLRILVTNDNLTVKEAEEFATEMQTAKPKTIRDDGFKIKALQESMPDASYAELGEKFGWNKVDVGRRLKAAEIPAAIISYFPMSISLRQFNKLHKLVFDKFKGDEEGIIEILKEVNNPDSSFELEDTETLISRLEEIAQPEKTPAKAEKTNLPLSSSFKGARAKKEISTSGMVSYKFKGLPDDAVEAIESFIVSVLSKESDNP